LNLKQFPDNINPSVLAILIRNQILVYFFKSKMAACCAEDGPFVACAKGLKASTFDYQ